MREHPLKRVMEMRRSRGRLEVTTSDAKLVRRAHHGALDYEWTGLENVMGVSWSR